MSRAVSPSTGRPYGILRVTRLWGVSRATVYRYRRPPEAIARSRPGPRGALPDDELAEEIRTLLEAGPFHGEGYRKVWARLRFKGIRTAKRRGGCSASCGSTGCWRRGASAGRTAPRRTTARSGPGESTSCGARI